MQDPVWFITGCSTGFGLALATEVLAEGGRAVVTARDIGHLDALVEQGRERVLPVVLDVTRDDQVGAAVAAAEEKFGRIDVLVNNAGYGYQASCEEGEEAQIRAQFDANVFGLFAMTRAVLPGMRARRAGHIINITSMAGFIGFPGSGYYSASKHAVEGFSDSLAVELKPLNIAVTCVEPGPFRTDWAGRSLKQTQTHVAEYQETVGARLKQTSGYSGKQAGDPVRAARAMMRLVEEDVPPRHLVLGAIAFDGVTKKLRERLEQIEARRETALGADFPA